MKTLTLTPAYGRDYKTKKAVRAAWLEGRDFVVTQFGCPPDYINKEDADKTGVTVNIRFKDLRSICVIKPEVSGRPRDLLEAAL